MESLKKTKFSTFEENKLNAMSNVVGGIDGNYTTRWTTYYPGEYTIQGDQKTTADSCQDKSGEKAPGGKA